PARRARSIHARETRLPRRLAGLHRLPCPRRTRGVVHRRAVARGQPALKLSRPILRRLPLLGCPGPHLQRRSRLWRITHCALRTAKRCSRRIAVPASRRLALRSLLPPRTRLHATLRELLLPRGHAASAGLRPLRRASPAHCHADRPALALPPPQ